MTKSKEPSALIAATPSKPESKKTSRRNFVAGAVLGAGALAMPRISRAETIIKFQSAWGSGIFYEFSRDYVDRVNKLANGSLKIDLLPVNAIVKTSEMQTAVHKGVLDGAYQVTAYWYSKSPTSSLFGTGPCFGWSANEVLGWIHYGGGYKLYEELLENLRLNIVGFFSGPMPAQPFGWFKQQITDVSQIRGLKYRTVGLAADVLQEMGMSVVQLPGGEIQPAMKSGLIDAAEFNNPSSDKDFGMQDVSKDYMLGSFHQSQECFEIIFNKTLLNNLSDEQNAVLKYAAEAASSDMSWKAMERYSADLVTLREEHGVNVHRTPDSVMAAQLAGWDKVIARVEGEDPFFAKVVKSQKDWAKRHGAYALNNAPNYRLAYEHYFGKL